ncbi:hypothetical protein GCM10008941_21880 [Rhizomicrobium palustre]
MTGAPRIGARVKQKAALSDGLWSDWGIPLRVIPGEREARGKGTQVERLAGPQ